MGLADKKIREGWVRSKNLKAFNFYKEDEMEEVDIIIKTPVSYEVARKGMVRFKSGNIELPVISIANLIKMKKAAGRDIDKMDINRLERARRLGAKK